MKAFWRSRELSTVFGASGIDENSATAALGWTLAQSPTFARALLEDLFGEQVDASELRVDMQRHEPGAGGFTDIELRTGSECHAIIEAKVGWVIPTESQFRLYAERIDPNASRLTKLVSLTAMNRRFVKLPPKLAVARWATGPPNEVNPSFRKARKTSQTLPGGRSIWSRWRQAKGRRMRLMGATTRCRATSHLHSAARANTITRRLRSESTTFLPGPAQ